MWLTDTLYYIFFLVLIAQELINIATYPGVMTIRAVRVPTVVCCISRADFSKYWCPSPRGNWGQVVWYEPLPPSTICAPNWEGADISDMLFVFYQNFTASRRSACNLINHHYDDLKFHRLEDCLTDINYTSSIKNTGWTKSSSAFVKEGFCTGLEVKPSLHVACQTSVTCVWVSLASLIVTVSVVSFTFTYILPSTCTGTLCGHLHFLV